ncbi:MAG: ATP-grasp domain-containing protein [Erysipelotrichaceae bacterium]|nr:ATP-grasp domain-containing protein [Erysipelotrichaceae bacterium]
MEARDDDVPIRKTKLTVGIVYNLKKGIKSKAVDEEAEYDSVETLGAISEALSSSKINIELLEADQSILKKITNTKVDIVFNIAEGLNGKGREAQIPALLSMLKIPFTGSDETTLCLALDKALTKRLVSTYHIKTPRYLLVKAGDLKPQTSTLKYPLIVKPNAEGSSKGVNFKSVVRNKKELLNVLQESNAVYNCDMLIEEFIDGREFTVGILGNGSTKRVFEPMEIVYRNRNEFNIYSYEVKQDYDKYVTYQCPSSISQSIIAKMKKDSEKIFDILGCLDFARIDFRVSDDEQVYFIEINPLPGLAYGYSDYPMLAAFNNVDYQTLVNSILMSAVDRYKLNFESEAN